METSNLDSNNREGKDGVRFGKTTTKRTLYPLRENSFLKVSGSVENTTLRFDTSPVVNGQIRRGLGEIRQKVGVESVPWGLEGEEIRYLGFR